jgi:hypothetical protein
MGTTKGQRSERSIRRLELARTASASLTRHRVKTGANPMELGAALEAEQVSEHRNLGCPLYDACLGHVVAAEWASFSCTKCAWRREGSLERAEDAPRRWMVAE